MQVEKSFVWSETDIKDVIRYLTSISDRFRIYAIKLRSFNIHQKWDLSDHVCKRFAAIRSQSELFTWYSESAKTTLQDDELETIISLSWHENNHQSEQISANSKHLFEKDIEANRNEWIQINLNLNEVRDNQFAYVNYWIRLCQLLKKLI
jgi:hypothetical protein